MSLLRTSFRTRPRSLVWGMDRHGRMVETADEAQRRAEQAEAERDAALARCEKWRLVAHKLQRRLDQRATLPPSSRFDMRGPDGDTDG